MVVLKGQIEGNKILQAARDKIFPRYYRIGYRNVILLYILVTESKSNQRKV